MFHLQSIELLHWDYCQRLTLPLDGSIIAVAGPNGSGKTTLLDAMRTLLGLDCSGGRNYKTYARHANAESVWLRATVDNRPRTRQTSSRPFSRCLLHADRVTLACRIDRNAGEWRRRYAMIDGDVAIEALVELPEKDWLGLEHWRGRLEGAGLSRAIARVLSLEQGQTDRLCEYSPKDLLHLVFDVFGDQDVLERYEEARRHQGEVANEVEAARRDLAHGQAQLAQLDARVNLYRQYQSKQRERQALLTEVIPVLEWREQRDALTTRARDLDRQRKAHNATRQQQERDRKRLFELEQQRSAAEAELTGLNAAVGAAQHDLTAANVAERRVADIVAEANELERLATVETDAAGLLAHLEALRARKSELDADWHALQSQQIEATRALEALDSASRAPMPADVTRLRGLLRAAGIDHHLVADVVDVTDPAWRAAAEGVLRASRWVVVLERPQDEAQALALAERERYRHYVVAEAVTAPAAPPADSLMAVLAFSAPIPAWLARQLAQIRRVESTRDGLSQGGEWITREAYWRDARGGRSVWVEPADYQFGAAAVLARRQSLQRRLADLAARLDASGEQQTTMERQLKAAEQAARGHQAATELLQRGETFARARSQLPRLVEARRLVGERWGTANRAVEQAQARLGELRRDRDETGRRLDEAESQLARHNREWEARRRELREASRESTALRRRFPPRWIAADTLDALHQRYGNSTQARLRDDAVAKELKDGEWETDASVEERHTLMVATVKGHKGMLQQREASNEAARIAVGNARERYIDVLRSTVRRYRRNITELGQLAGVEVNADLPHLDNDDTVLRQAELKVNFNFDGKGQIGLNDGEASGGQQVMKSLILLVGLLKDDDMPGGFVFIDEPFAHLDVRNIQLVGNFLKATRAQYVLTTPITHNVEVFEPADVTLVTSKKPPGARWAPPIGVLQRRAEAPAG